MLMVKPLEYDEISMTKAWIDCSWMSMTREEREKGDQVLITS
jgi:hypothetical protein